MKPKTILLGICGWGNGHCMRQTPVIQHLLEQGHTVVAFGFMTSLKNFKALSEKHPHFHLIEVPYFFTHADNEGVSFKISAQEPHNLQSHVFSEGFNAIAKAEKIVGRNQFDIVISDSEWFSSFYANLRGLPLLGFDNQSKWTTGNFPDQVDGYPVTDANERCRMYYPNPTERIAISFFTFPQAKKPDDKGYVRIFPPIIRQSVLSLKDKSPTKKRSIVVYLSPNQTEAELIEGHENLVTAITKQTETDFHVFLPEKFGNLPQAIQVESQDLNVNYYYTGDKQYLDLFGASHGVIANAGHTMSSEAMFLAKPYLAIPLKYYEQAYNASRIEKGQFGMKRYDIDAETLKLFLSKLPQYNQNILQDKGKELNREPGQDMILEAIDNFISSPSKNKIIDKPRMKLSMF